MGEALIARGVEEGADVHLVAAGSVALDALVFVRVVQSFHSRVALGALDATLAVVPAHAVLERLAVLWRILKQVRRAAEISRVVRINAAF